MSDAKQAWKQWLDEIKKEAADLERLAAALDGEASPFRPEVIAIQVDTDGGRAAYVGIGEAFADVRRKTCIALRGRAHEIRKLPAEAKWLGDPKRAAVLAVVALVEDDEQNVASKALPRATREAIGWSGHRLIHGYRPRALVDRIVAGARLYAATKGKP